jgi:catechol 2,3-dioxygenase-like lactoylglutathione lyase family enzyme
MGLRLVKLTINFDDPGTYHLYYGDGIGHPGTILTFFPWPKAPGGRKGAGQVTATSFAVPAGSIPYWVARLDEHRIRHAGPLDRFGEQVLSFSDSDGLGVELISTSNLRADRVYAEGPVPLEYAIHGFHSATLTELRDPLDAAQIGLLARATPDPRSPGVSMCRSGHQEEDGWAQLTFLYM